jgi:predicted transcriptional regulator of viral defense system
VEQLASAGRYSFTGREAHAALGVSASAALLALNRLAKQGLLASPAKSFYVIVPPEYRSLGCLPAEQFVPDLMKWLKRPYYVCLLSASEYHGAAHQRPQALQVFLEGKRRPIACGRVRVIFMVRKHLRVVPVQTVNTPRGGLLVSTPEATALDLVGYEQQAGGLNLVATVLSELAERLEPHKLAAAANAAPIVWAQRLGYLLQRVGAADKVGPLQEHVRARAQDATPLAPGSAFRTSPRDAAWKVYVNAAVEADL